MVVRQTVENVGIDRHGFIGPDDGIQTTDLNTCIGVAIWNKTQNCAGIVHASGAHMNMDPLSEFLGDFCHSHMDGNDEIEIYVCGGNDADLDGAPSVNASRGHVIQELKGYFPDSSPVINWIKGHDERASMALTVSTIPGSNTFEAVME